MKYMLRKNYMKNIVQQADQCPQLGMPLDKYNNPLIIKSLLNFTCVCSKFDLDEDI